MSGFITTLDNWDASAYRKVASTTTPRLDAVLPRLTGAANYGALWALACGLLMAQGPRARKAAKTGMLSFALANSVANVPAKYAVRRPRPALHDVPLARQLSRQPTSTSFPSGHSASAAAFAVGVGLEYPLAATPIAAVAALVAYSRVHTGVHYPGDILAGVTLGAGCAWWVHRHLNRHTKCELAPVLGSAES